MKEPLKVKIKRAAMYLLGFSATPMLTACYGMPYQDPIDNVPFDGISGGVYDAKTGEPIAGIKVFAGNTVSTTTNSEGRYFLDHHFDQAVRVTAKDIDGATNGEYFDSSTFVTSLDNHDTNFSLMQQNKD
ncbi:MAG: hypothetical protein U0L45_07370 [Alistipes sp.]|nr:hypothetical protein [Alistipes sp.]